MSVRNLQSALDELIIFLEPTESRFWVKKLQNIRLNLSNEALRSETISELENMFGGMGSLNDLYFCETNSNLPKNEKEDNFNARFSKLMDKVFKELRLINSGLLARIQWKWLEIKHRGELPPRIRKTFR